MSELVISSEQTGFTPKQVAVLRQLGLDKASEGDLAVFFHQCVRTGLDPFAKQVYMVGRWDGRSNSMRYTIQTGIDGYRLIAERTGQYAGSDESWDIRDKFLVSSTVTVHKIVDGIMCNFTATAHYQEYVQTGKDGMPMGLWQKMPYRMLAKCAEALALRKAFPQDLSGLYTAEEMAQADNVTQSVVSSVPAETETAEITASKAAHPTNHDYVGKVQEAFDAEIVEFPTQTAQLVKKPSPAQITLMKKLAKERGISDAELVELAPVAIVREISSLDDLTSKDMFKLNNYLMNLPKEK